GKRYFGVGKISPSTLRYIKVLSDLMLHFGDLNNLKICEIGVGYGGQARIIMSKFNVQSYTFVDLQSALDLSKKYLSCYEDLNQEKLLFANLDALNTSDYDLVISNYAFSELSKDIQDLYLEKIINNATHGYITYNDISGPSLGSYKIENYKDIIHKNIQILEEKPLTHPLNRIVVW
ncbi:putative sugar O-methyltransferase, partial [Helicobacter sp. CLO-3]